MSDINFYVCGGTGINVALDLKKGAKTPMVQKAKFIGLDASDRNDAKDEFPVERMDGVRGSGKKRDLNFDKAIPFVEAAMAKHKPNSYNVVIANSAGGSGSMLAVLTMRHLIKAGHIAVLCLVSDHTSLVEKTLSVGGLRSFANQCAKNQLNAAIPYLEYYNTEDKTRGEVNEQIVNGLNLLSLFLTETNGEMDYQDTKHFFNYPLVTGMPPALSRIHFYDQTAAPEYDGKAPVAVASLFNTSAEIVPLFVGSVYRTTGVFAEGNNRPKNIQQLHMTLDHGEALAKLEKEMESVDEDKAQAANTYVQQKDLSQGSNDLGMVM